LRELRPIDLLDSDFGELLEAERAHLFVFLS